MLDLVNGEVLLVGEGDFSFAVSLVSRSYPHDVNFVTATSLETPTSIKKHVTAESNMAWLKDRGVDVVLETDATQLHNNSTFKNNQYDRIIFNFPHAGGKSNHKKNRKLIKDFFHSAVFLLKDEGQILMSLCKGQGGTPADQPMRAWHDSWQVVSMAANAGLLLSQIVPFVSEDFHAYTSTGFRSQNKGFNTEGALTHVFVRGSPVSIPIYDSDIGLGVNTSYIHKALHRKLLQEEEGPLCLLRKHLESAFEQEFGKENFSVELRSPLIEENFRYVNLTSRRKGAWDNKPSETGFTKQPMEFKLSQTVDGIMDKDDTSAFIGSLYFNEPIRFYLADMGEKVDISNKVQKKDDIEIENGTCEEILVEYIADKELHIRKSNDIKQANIDKMEIEDHLENSEMVFKTQAPACDLNEQTLSGCENLKQKHLRVSLLEHLDDIVSRTEESDKCTLLSGEVVRCCPINHNMLPVRHEMLGIVNLPCDLSHDTPHDSPCDTSGDVKFITDINLKLQSLNSAELKSSNSATVKQIFKCLNTVCPDRIKFSYRREIIHTKHGYLCKMGCITVSSAEKQGNSGGKHKAKSFKKHKSRSAGKHKGSSVEKDKRRCFEKNKREKNGDFVSKTRTRMESRHCKDCLLTDSSSDSEGKGKKTESKYAMLDHECPGKRTELSEQSLSDSESVDEKVVGDIREEPSDDAINVGKHGNMDSEVKEDGKFLQSEILPQDQMLQYKKLSENEKLLQDEKLSEDESLTQVEKLSEDEKLQQDEKLLQDDKKLPDEKLSEDEKLLQVKLLPDDQKPSQCKKQPLKEILTPKERVLHDKKLEQNERHVQDEQLGEFPDHMYEELPLGEETKQCFENMTVDNFGNPIVGYIWSTTSKIRNDHEFKTSLIFLLDLDIIALILFKIPQIRLLWSAEDKMLKQFYHESDIKYPIFKPFSLYPLIFKHDMSFWQNPSKEFNEFEYFDIIRDVAFDAVIAVYLIDSYHDNETGKTSRCYRLEFQSGDRVLSYDTSWKLQSIIRLEVAKRLDVILR